MPLKVPPNIQTYSQLGRFLSEWLIDNYLSKNQQIRLFSHRSYGDITHDLYYHIGKFFKKRYLYEKKQARSLRVQLFPYPTFMAYEKFADDTDIPRALREAYDEYLKAKKDWQEVFSWIRGTSEDAYDFRSGVSLVAKEILHGNFVLSSIEQSPYQSEMEQFAQWKEENDQERIF
jgi:hypothetical protein